MSVGWAFAVRNRIGATLCRRISAQADTPSMPGIMMSRMMRS